MTMLDALEAGLEGTLAELFGSQARVTRAGDRLVVAAGGESVLVDARGTVDGEGLLAEQVVLAIDVMRMESEPERVFPGLRAVAPEKAEVFLEVLDRRVRGEVKRSRPLGDARIVRRGPLLMVVGASGHCLVHESGRGRGDGLLWQELRPLVAMTAAEAF